MRDRESFPSTEEEFDFGFNSLSKDNNKYSPSIVAVDNDRFEEEFETVFSIQIVKSFLNECRMQWLCNKVHPSIELRLLETDDDLSKSPPSTVIFHYTFFIYVLRLSLFSIFYKILHMYGLILGQLNPHTWCTMVCCYILWKEYLNARIQYLHLYCLKKVLIKGFFTVGWYYASARGDPIIIVRDHSFRASKNWQRK